MTGRVGLGMLNPTLFFTGCQLPVRFSASDGEEEDAMVNTVTTAALVAAMTAGVAARGNAASGPEPVVVVHVTSYVQVSLSDLAEAEQQATRVYRNAGVRTVWTDRAAVTAAPDDAFHVDVILLSKEMMVHKCQEDGIGAIALGTATRATRRVYVFYSRVAEHAASTQSPISRLLGGVLAHEIGHTLLTNGHSPSGIMRATWEGRIARVPGFTDAQAATIRGRLAPATAN